MCVPILEIYDVKNKNKFVLIILWPVLVNMSNLDKQNNKYVVKRFHGTNYIDIYELIDKEML